MNVQLNLSDLELGYLEPTEESVEVKSLASMCLFSHLSSAKARTQPSGTISRYSEVQFQTYGCKLRRMDNISSIWHSITCLNDGHLLIS